MSVIGLQQSFLHVDNGMTMEDMVACRSVANRSGEVIIFRSTGSWSMRWIARRYPTKNFHVKGKSSDWGPQEGFVPYDGRFSKVGGDAAKAEAGTKANQSGIDDKYAGQVQLRLAAEELRLQLEQPAGNPPKKACVQAWPVGATRDLLLRALRSGDDKPFLFRAVQEGDGRFALYVLDDDGMGQVKFNALQFDLVARGGKFDPKAPGAFKPLMVMTSAEVGADNKPMTGDYDLMAVCPPWNDYGTAASADIVKERIQFTTGRSTVGQHFAAGRGLDKVLDMTTNTGAASRDPKKTFQGLGKGEAGKGEHKDMGNITGRILRCINALNAEMPNGATALRRVHHNAESHRNHLFGALTGAEMEGGDGFPMTVFQPAALYTAQPGRTPPPTARFLDVATFETLAEFKEYALLLNQAGYFVPRNWTWGMSIRDDVRRGRLGPHDVR
jgi:hypothetical protein